MTWQIDTINEFESRVIDGEVYVRRDEVTELLNRQCKDCRFFETRVAENHRGKLRKDTICTNAVNIFRQTEKYVGKTNRGCKRFERK